MPFCLKFFAATTITEREHQAIKLADHTQMLLRKLGNYSRKNRLYQAFRELGRVVRTAFLLNYISDLELRDQITATTNKVEAYNGFSKWLFFGGGRHHRR